MTCNSINYLEYYPGDNNTIKVTVANDDGTRIPDLSDDLSNAIFKAVNSEGEDAITLAYAGDNPKIIYAVVDNEDVFTISPATTDTQIPVGEYDIFFKIVLINPDRSMHVKMTSNGIKLSKLKILDGGA